MVKRKVNYKSPNPNNEPVTKVLFDKPEAALQALLLAATYGVVDVGGELWELPCDEIPDIIEALALSVSELAHWDETAKLISNCIANRKVLASYKKTDHH